MSMGRLTVGTESVGVNGLCLLLSASCFLGAVPVAAEALASSVLRSPNCLPNSAGRPMGPSTPLCVLCSSDVLMAFCHLSWCCEAWFCFYVSLSGN